jgi:hypothetical protein
MWWKKKKEVIIVHRRASTWKSDGEKEKNVVFTDESMSTVGVFHSTFVCKTKKKKKVGNLPGDARRTSQHIKRGILSINRLKEKEKNHFHIRRDKKWANFISNFKCNQLFDHNFAHLYSPRLRKSTDLSYSNGRCVSLWDLKFIKENSINNLTMCESRVPTGAKLPGSYYWSRFSKATSTLCCGIWWRWWEKTRIDNTMIKSL